MCLSCRATSPASIPTPSGPPPPSPSLLLFVPPQTMASSLRHVVAPRGAGAGQNAPSIVIRPMVFPGRQEALHHYFLGDNNRTVAETPHNLNSSRSHCIFTIYVEAITPEFEQLACHTFVAVVFVYTALCAIGSNFKPELRNLLTRTWWHCRLMMSAARLLHHSIAFCLTLPVFRYTIVPIVMGSPLGEPPFSCSRRPAQRPLLCLRYLRWSA